MTMFVDKISSATHHVVVSLQTIKGKKKGNADGQKLQPNLVFCCAHMALVMFVVFAPLHVVRLQWKVCVFTLLTYVR